MAENGSKKHHDDAVKRPVGENAHERAIRLLREFNSQVCRPGSGEEVRINVGPDGSGYLRLWGGRGDYSGEDVFGFTGEEGLLMFLEGDQADRLLLVKAWQLREHAARPRRN